MDIKYVKFLLDSAGGVEVGVGYVKGYGPGRSYKLFEKRKGGLLSSAYFSI